VASDAERPMDGIPATAPGTKQAGRSVVPLRSIVRNDASWAGAKAANLGKLLRAGFPVPDGFVVTGDPDGDLPEAVAALGDGPLAVRSSGVAEDLAEASFAGQYETVLNVRGVDPVREAVRRCCESAASERVAQYRRGRAAGAAEGIAVLVQRMVVADAAGVAFTANPITGDRGEVIVSAVRGQGERLVSGKAVPDEWVVRGTEATCCRSSEGAIAPDQALAIADLARRAEALFGTPQDIEWAIAGGQLLVLQSRPMTSVPEPADWTPPASGYWMRNFRLGEWLPEPVTPLFWDWLLPRIHRGFARGAARDVGVEISPAYVAVNGWYYTTPIPNRPLIVLAVGLATHPLKLLRFVISLGTQTRRPEIADRLLVRQMIAYWEQELLPRYRSLVEDCEAKVEQASPAELADMVDRVGTLAGECYWSLAGAGGSAWKVEAALAHFFRKHLASRLAVDMPVLLAGFAASAPATPPCAVQSADWYRPTLGELGLAEAADHADQADRKHRLSDRRQAAEAACRAALAEQPRLLARFNELLAMAHRYGAIREQQAAYWTLGWPLLRRCVLRLGDVARRRGAISQAEHAFFLTRAELAAATDEMETFDRSDIVSGRRAVWERQRRLVAPLTLGERPKLVERELRSLEALRSDQHVPEGALVGQPASPGRASGPVRIVRGPEDFGRFQAGEVLVAQSTTPGWTPLLSRAVAVVTDSGSLAAHASLIAREYGIPAVVATHDATSRLADGRRVTVDGSAGFVDIRG
jgi:rifampicin phosphotransferase